MNWSRIRSSRNYYDVQDSYRVPSCLQAARLNYEPFGLPTSVTVNKITSNPQGKPVSPFDFACKTSSKLRPRLSTSLPSFGIAKHTFSCKAKRLGRKVSGWCNTGAYNSSRVHYKQRQSLPTFSSLSTVDSGSGCAEKVFGASVEEEEQDRQAEEGDISLPALKSYKIESTEGSRFHVVEIGIPCRKQKLGSVLSFSKGRVLDQRRQCPGRYMKAIVFSEKGASMMWMFQQKIRIILMSNDEPTTSQWFNKIRMDSLLIKSTLNEQAGSWHPLVQRKLKHAVDSCRNLVERMNQSEAVVPKIIPDFQAANEAILRAARFVWHSLGAKSASSLSLPTEGHDTSPASSVVDLSTKPELDDGSSLNSSIKASEHNIDDFENRTLNDQKSRISKLFQEFVKIWDSVSSKTNKSSQIMPLDEIGDGAMGKPSKESITDVSAEVRHGLDDPTSSVGAGSIQPALIS